MRLTFLASCLLAGAIPIVSPRHPTEIRNTSPHWFTHWEGKQVSQLPLTDKEKSFSKDFPGKIARFTDGKKEIIFRWVDQPTRRLHPSADCFRAMGYAIKTIPIANDAWGMRWSRFEAIRQGSALVVSEVIYDNAGRNWTDASSWYWAALLRRTKGPWWAVTIAEQKGALDNAVR